MLARNMTSRMSIALLVGGFIIFPGSYLNRVTAAHPHSGLSSGLGQRSDQGASQTASVVPGGDQYFKNIYREFYDTYKLGPDDEIAIRVLGQPDYSLDKVKISGVGRVYHPLVGEIEVVGLTLNQLTNKLSADFSQYIISPKVSVSLIEASSAKIGVLGEVKMPGIRIMAKPMTVLDAITASGGVADYGSQTNVTLLRQMADGRFRTMKVNVKRILQGKADPEENVVLQAGDTIIVHGNLIKKIGQITSVTGFASFITSLGLR